jgi:hypothetical protein
VRRCSRCGIALPEGSRRSRRYCGATCRRRAWRLVRARRAQLDAGGEAMPALTEGRRHPWPRFRCPEYGSTWFTGETPFGIRKRSDSRSCSPRCRTRAWRKRSRSAAVTESRLPVTPPRSSAMGNGRPASRPAGSCLRLTGLSPTRKRGTRAGETAHVTGVQLNGRQCPLTTKTVGGGASDLGRLGRLSNSPSRYVHGEAARW